VGKGKAGEGTYPEDHGALDDTGNGGRCRLEDTTDEVDTADIALGLDNLAAIRSASHNRLLRRVIRDTAAAAHDDAARALLGHVDGQVPAKTLETADEEVRRLGREGQLLGGGTHRHLDVERVLAAGDDDLADVAAAADVRERRWDVIEAEGRDGLDGLDVSGID
jgi:hypothetical protein